MKPIELLMEEHEAIKLMLRILEQVCEHIESGKEIEVKDLEDVLEFIRGFADSRHHKKEEDLLFPAMEEAGIPRHGGPIGMMLMEHDKGRSYVKEMVQVVAEQKSGKKLRSKDFIENALEFIALLRQHIEKENNILYPMASQSLSAKQQAELQSQFDKVEHSYENGKHKSFIGILEKLKIKYL